MRKTVNSQPSPLLPPHRINCIEDSTSRIGTPLPMEQDPGVDSPTVPSRRGAPLGGTGTNCLGMRKPSSYVQVEYILPRAVQGVGEPHACDRQWAALVHR